MCVFAMFGNKTKKWSKNRKMLINRCTKFNQVKYYNFNYLSSQGLYKNISYTILITFMESFIILQSRFYLILSTCFT